MRADATGPGLLVSSETEDLMPAFHLLRCMVAVGGDSGNQVYRHRGIPIVFPELPILQFLHGEEAITDVHVVGQWETTNDEVLARLLQLYTPEVVKEVFPGARPRLPLADASIPRCTLPIYKLKPTLPDSPDPKLRPLDQFTLAADTVLDAPELPPESIPSPDEIAAHAQDDDDDGDALVDPAEDAATLGLGPIPRPEDQAHIVRDTLGRGASSHKGPASRHPANLPDVNAGGSHAPRHVQQHRSRQ